MCPKAAPGSHAGQVASKASHQAKHGLNDLYLILVVNIYKLLSTEISSYIFAVVQDQSTTPCSSCKCKSITVTEKVSGLPYTRHPDRVSTPGAIGPALLTLAA